jgi:hypothetical protein
MEDAWLALRIISQIDWIAWVRGSIGLCSTAIDSKVPSLITDSVTTLVPRKPESDEHVARLLSLMGDLVKRMDLLDRRHRNLAEEMRLRERRERRRRPIGLLAAASLLLAVGGWVKSRIDAPSVLATAMDRP